MVRALVGLRLPMSTTGFNPIGRRVLDGNSIVGSKVRAVKVVVDFYGFEMLGVETNPVLTSL